MSHFNQTIFLILVCVFSAVSFTGCAPGEGDSSRYDASGSSAQNVPLKQPLQVVATYSILADWVQKIGGERVALTVLVGAGGDAHTYEPTPQDSVALEKADLLFENGLAFEVWLDGLFDASNSDARRVVVSKAIKPRELVVSESRTEIDPHVWHLPENARIMVESITSALEKADPHNASEYRQRQSDYVVQLNELDKWISQQTASIPESRRKLVTTHDTFGYLADKYGFEVISVLGSVSSETADPSAGQVAEVIKRISDLKLPAIFAENILNPKLTQKIADESGVKIVPTLYTDALGSTTSPASDYLKMMRFNVKTICESLR